MFRGVKSASKLALNRKLSKPVVRFACNHQFSAFRGSQSQQQSLPKVAGINVRCMSTSGPQTMEFQAETRKLLDIVTNSIYTDREVFIRELISNASDALEKFRYKQVTGEVGSTDATPLEINIYTDDKRKTLTIVDNGIGMTREELVANLGTIAKSGSKQFVESLKSDSAADSGTRPASEGIIGQFGVGFYSSFMVSDSVEVESLSAADATGGAHKWSSDGSGVFQIDSVSKEVAAEHLTAHRGSRITMKLKDSCEDYAYADKIKR